MNNIPGSIEVNNQSYEKKGLEKVLDLLPAELRGTVNENDWLHYDMESKVALLQHYGLYERYLKRVEMEEAGIVPPTEMYEQGPQYQPAESIPEAAQPPISPISDSSSGFGSQSETFNREAPPESLVEQGTIELNQEPPAVESPVTESLGAQDIQEASPTLEQAQAQQIEQVNQPDNSLIDKAPAESIESSEILPENQESGSQEQSSSETSGNDLGGEELQEEMVTEEVEEIIDDNKGDPNNFAVSLGYIIPESVIATADQLKVNGDPVDAETWMATWVEKITAALED